MAITLTYAGTTIDLSDRLDWTDEYAWSPVVQQVDYSVTGALIVGVAVKQAGRPITLDGEQTAAWISRQTCDTVAAWSALPGAQFTLVLRGVARTVMFDTGTDGSRGFSARPLWRLLDGEVYPEQVFVPRLRFLEV